MAVKKKSQSPAKDETRSLELVAKKSDSKSSAHESMSSLLWNIDWTKHFPRDFGNGVIMEYSRYADAVEFIKPKFPEIFYLTDRPSPFRSENFSHAKEVYYHITGDFFLFKRAGQVIGVIAGTPTDWATYNLRSIAFLPEEQDKGLYQIFFPIIAKILQDHKVERMEGDIAPTNLRHIHVATKMGCRITGLNLTERFGTLLHFTIFLDRDCQKVFAGQFCHGFDPKAEGF